MNLATDTGQMKKEITGWKKKKKKSQWERYTCSKSIVTN